MTLPQNDSAANRFINRLLDLGNLPNDAALSRMLKVAPSAVSKVRHGRTKVNASMMIRIHEEFDLPIREIKGALAE